MAAAPDRYHALDCLRGCAMFLGVLLHVAISYMTHPPAFWPARDNDPFPLADLFLIAVHDFRMQLFFLLAGFFGGLLYGRYGVVGMARHRVRRVLLPFALAVVFVIPTVQAVILYAEIENVRAGGLPGDVSMPRKYAGELVATNPRASTEEHVAAFFTSGAFLLRMALAHLWFLYFLLYFYAAVFVLAPLLARLSGTRVLARTDARFRRMIEGHGRVLVPALFTFPLMLPMRWIVDTPTTWLPQWHILGYYFAFFAFGWMLYRHRDLVPAFGRGWKRNLAVANLLVLPLMVWLLFVGVNSEKAGADAYGVMLLTFAASVMYTWLMIVSVWGAFLHGFARESGWVRYMADASYWCYLASITPIVLLQFWTKDWPLPGPVKFVLVTAVTMAVLLGSYELFVRYTFVGAILNGRKTRMRRELPPVTNSVAPATTS